MSKKTVKVDEYFDDPSEYKKNGHTRRNHNHRDDRKQKEQVKQAIYTTKTE